MADGWDSTVGTVTCYGLDGPRTESIRGHRPAWTTHPASCIMGTKSFLEEQWQGCGADYTTPTNGKVAKVTALPPSCACTGM
jgi:hypothetical protein